MEGASCGPGVAVVGTTEEEREGGEKGCSEVPSLTPRGPDEEVGGEELGGMVGVGGREVGVEDTLDRLAGGEVVDIEAVGTVETVVWATDWG